MKNPTRLTTIFLFVGAITVLTLATGCGCDGPSDVVSITRIKADELPSNINPGPEPQYRILIKVVFSVDIDPANLAAPGNFNVSAKGSSGKEDNQITGSVQYLANMKTAYFISANPLGFSPGAGENVTYTVQIVGNGDNCVKRQSGECIDGCDNDTTPGGNHTKSIFIVG